MKKNMTSLCLRTENRAHDTEVFLTVNSWGGVGWGGVGWGQVSSYRA